jgi:hypothetical protein
MTFLGGSSRADTSVGDFRVVPGPGSRPGQALVPGIHDLNSEASKTWMAGTSPVMTRQQTKFW